MSTRILTGNADQIHKDIMLNAWVQELAQVQGWFFPTSGSAVQVTNAQSLTFGSPTSITLAGKPGRQRQAGPVTLTVNTAQGTVVNRIIINVDVLEPGDVTLVLDPVLNFPDGGSIVVNHVRARVVDAL